MVIVIKRKDRSNAGSTLFEAKRTMDSVTTHTHDYLAEQIRTRNIILSSA